MGPFMRTAINGIPIWQFDNEDGSRDDAVDWLRGQKEFSGHVVGRQTEPDCSDRPIGSEPGIRYPNFVLFPAMI